MGGVSHVFFATLGTLGVQTRGVGSFDNFVFRAVARLGDCPGFYGRSG